MSDSFSYAEPLFMPGSFGIRLHGEDFTLSVIMRGNLGANQVTVPREHVIRLRNWLNEQLDGNSTVTPRQAMETALGNRVARGLADTARDIIRRHGDVLKMKDVPDDRVAAVTLAAMAAFK